MWNRSNIPIRARVSNRCKVTYILPEEALSVCDTASDL